MAQVKLDDGTPVTIRPVSRSDRELFRRGIMEASTDLLRDRFHGSNFHLTEEALDYLTCVDQDSHLAVGATIPRSGKEYGIAVARCIRRPGEDTAELAVAVLDNYQRQGIGKALVSALSDFAARHEIRSFSAYVDAERRRFLARLGDIGFRTRSCHNGVSEIRLEFGDRVDSEAA